MRRLEIVNLIRQLGRNRSKREMGRFADALVAARTERRNRSYIKAQLLVTPILLKEKRDVFAKQLNTSLKREKKLF